MIDHAARPTTTPAEPAPADATRLPGPGPMWFSSVMGTGILSTLLGREATSTRWLLVPASGLMLIAVVLLVGLSVAFGARVAADRSVLTDTLRDVAVVPTWGTVSMGVLSVGSSLVTVVPQLAPGRLDGWAVGADAVLWTAGTLLGVVTAFGFAVVLVRRDVGRPMPVWGLPVVPPMVSATTGAALVPHVGGAVGHLALLVASVACFFLSLFLGGLVFALAYHHHWRVAPLPVAASISTWIPLGVVGQSTAAAQALATQTAALFTPGEAPAVHVLADAYGLLMVVVAVPVVAHAVRLTVRGFRAGLAFAPGWWALTFPIGTLALGCRMLGESVTRGAAGAGSASSAGSGLLGLLAGPTGAVVSAVGVLALVTLCGTWTFCAGATLRALRADRAHVSFVPA
ncbi:TDT family transporter [Terracoccus luteus]|uniref:Tellurite resistance protein TehA-like permease n=1 Tax=Terracoccus luteus TaxID=53356 RepID=A0A839PV31_9MICO|nr:TDT family transporter [Terracoccus luteus]MBB2988108.1 tellurite resistance protein TehA-like permease [Terracoccus luteus]MCP2173759.1 tellurite resistance protein TehA-like permease [Terracoccus luteus]